MKKKACVPCGRFDQFIQVTGPVETAGMHDEAGCVHAQCADYEETS